jgi:hypothetical protein
MNNKQKSRWTTKEAAYKALYPVHQAGWKERSLLKGKSSQTKQLVLLFHPSSAPSSGYTLDSYHYQLHPHISLLISISHDGPSLLILLLLLRPLSIIIPFLLLCYNIPLKNCLFNDDDDHWCFIFQIDG